MMLYKNMKAMVYSPCGDSIFDIVPGVLQRDKLSPFLFIIYLDFILWIGLRKKNGLALKMARSRKYTI